MESSLGLRFKGADPAVMKHPELVCYVVKSLRRHIRPVTMLLLLILNVALFQNTGNHAEACFSFST